jgi:hypothetical protein
MGTHVHVPLVRTHVMLEPSQYELLKQEARRSSLSMGELVRRAVDKTYRRGSRPTVLGYEVSVGLWKRPDAAVVGRRVRPYR